MAVFTEVRVTTTTRSCQSCQALIYRSDPVVSVRVSPWAYGPSTGAWEVLTFCEPCARHQVHGYRGAA